MSNEFLDAAERLADVLARENAALKRLDYASAVALVPAKETALAELTQQQAGQGTPPPITGQGKIEPVQMRSGQRLGALAAENQVLLARAMAVQTRILHIVARACLPPPVVPPYGGNSARSLSRRADALALTTRV